MLNSTRVVIPYVPPGYVDVLFCFFLLNTLKQVIIISNHLNTQGKKGNKLSQSCPAPSRLNVCQKARNRCNMQEKHQESESRHRP